MSRTRIRFADHFRVKHGYAFKSEYFADEGPFALLTPGNFNEEGGFRNRGDKQPYYTGEVPPAYILAKGDVIIAMTEQDYGLLGSSVWVPYSDYYLHNQRLGLIVDLNEKRLNKRFLYYLFNTREVRHQIAGSASGTKVRHTAPERIGRVEAEIPDIKIQERIADTLTAYDDLMENNRRRMALLEESARLLYREWFVHLRFPRHEHTRLINGVPQGWERVPLGEVMTLQRGHDLPSQERDEGDVPIVSSSGITGFHDKKKADAPGVVTGRYGTLGQVYYIDRDYWPLNTALYVTDFKGNPPLYILHLLKHALESIQSDKAAIPGLNRNVVHSMNVLRPPASLRAAFGDFAADVYRQISILTDQTQKLRTARDLLLPRLMSGEIEL